MATSGDGLPLRAAWMGRVGYDEAYQLQLNLLEQRYREEISDTLLLLEHPHVYTLGRRGLDEDVLVSPAELEAARATVVSTDRGGQTTYHGPGQLVGYPILDLRAMKLGPLEYVRTLEEMLIRLLGEMGVEGHRVEGKTGVWTYGSFRLDVAPPLESGEAKIAAIGVRVSRGISMHGFALNISTDLSYFDRIVPCGMPEVQMASVESIGGEAPDIERAADLAVSAFGDAFGHQTRNEKPEVLAA